MIYSHKRHHIFREIILVHFLPVAFNFTLLGLYVGRVLWTPPWPTTNVLNALQFAAKVHESLMIASLVTILLHHIRYRLLSPAHSSSGLPLGLVTSPFRLLDITYVWSKEFSAAWRHLRGHRVNEVMTIIFHVFLFILVAILGPASAIAMLPKLGEWDLSSKIVNAPFYSTHHRNGIYQAYIGAPLSEIFPKTITANLIPEACDYSNLSLPQTNTCPRLGLMDIVQGMPPPEKSEELASPPYNVSDDYQDQFMPSYNITVQANHEALLPARILCVSSAYWPMCIQEHVQARDDQSFQIGVDVTTSTDAILYLTKTLMEYYLDYWSLTVPGVYPLSDFLSTGDWPAKFTPYPGQQRDSGKDSSAWKQPYVSSFCSRSKRNTNISGPIYFEFGAGACQPLYTVSLHADYLSRRLNATSMGFLELSEMEIMPSYTPSAAFAFVSQSYTTLCLVKANWVDSTISGSYWSIIDSAPDTLAWTWQAASSNDLTWNNGSWFTNTNATDNIHLDPAWLTVLDQGTGSHQTSKYSFFKKVREVCIGTSALDSEDPSQVGQHPDPLCMASGLASGIAEGLSKVPYHFDVYALGSTEDATYGHPAFPMMMSPWTYSRDDAEIALGLLGNWSLSSVSPSQISANSTRFDFNVTQKLYGYGFRGVTITLAFIVLFLYVATVLVHIMILIFGTSWSSRAWKSPGELLVLALRSPIPDTALDNTGGGVETSTTWQARASVQELQDGRVGVVIANPGELDTKDGSPSVVRPDWKYS